MEFIGRAQRTYGSEDGPEAAAIFADVINQKLYEDVEALYVQFVREELIEIDNRQQM